MDRDQSCVRIRCCRSEVRFEHHGVRSTCADGHRSGITSLPPHPSPFTSQSKGAIFITVETLLQERGTELTADATSHIDCRGSPAGGAHQLPSWSHSLKDILVLQLNLRTTRSISLNPYVLSSKQATLACLPRTASVPRRRSAKPPAGCKHQRTVYLE